MTEETRTLITYRLERADESLKEASLLLEGSFANAVVNRLYYACFYAVNALLLTKGYSSSKHIGVRSLFHQHFVKTGVVGVQSGKFYDNLFDNRQLGDYEDLVRFNLEDVRGWLNEAHQFVEIISKIVHKSLSKDSETEKSVP